MNSIKFTFFLFLTLIFTTYSYAGAVVTNGKHPVCSNLRYVSKDPSFYRNVYGKEYQEIAKEVFIYSLMSSNVYEEYDGSKPEFYIHDWKKVGHKRIHWNGFGAHIYESNTYPKQVAIAFEGTNPSSIADWLFGNLNLFWSGQYQNAKDLIDEVVGRYGEDTNITTTGHSLGGGLAIHAALHYKNVRAIAFNSSPRIFNPKREFLHKDKITLISENKDILKILRKKWPALGGVSVRGPYNEFDFLNETSLNEHSIYYIARGLTIVAAEADDFVANITLESYTAKEEVCQI